MKNSSKTGKFSETLISGFKEGNTRLLEGYGWVLDIEKGLLDIDGAMLDIEGAMLAIEEGILDIAAEGLEEKDDEEGISNGKLDELNVPDAG